MIWEWFWIDLFLLPLSWKWYKKLQILTIIQRVCEQECLTMIIIIWLWMTGANKKIFYISEDPLGY